MRSFRRLFLTMITLGAVLAPVATAAQEPRQPWQDSWYWGAYAGGASFRTTIARTTAPTVGAEWFITRSDVAVRIFAEQSSFTGATQLTIAGMAAPRLVAMADLKRVGFSVAMFTPSFGNVRPYVDLGYALNVMTSARDSVASYASTAQRDSVLQAINTAKSSGKIFASLGAMITMGKMAPFAQITLMPTKGDGKSLLNGDGFAYLLAAGLRYNFGRSVEKAW
jgi:hypothetical protein